MIETLTLDADSTTDAGNTLQQSAAPEVVIDGITFEGGQLWKARYPSLIEYSKVQSGCQVEPAIQITDPERLQMTVCLALAEGFVFQTANGGVKVQWVDGKDSSPPSCISAVLEDPRTCLVTWAREAGSPSAIALRFFCSSEAGCPKKGEPGHEECVVEGGVYLTFVVREEVWPDEIIKYLKEHPVPDPWEPPPSENAARMKVHALLLPEGRIRYDLFKQKPPKGAEFELAFRVSRGLHLEFDVEIFNPGFVYREKLASPEEVAREITYPESIEPLDLATPFGDHESICQVTWTSVISDDLSGLSCSFNLIARLAEGQQPSFRPVDPTVIEPPRCMNRICVGQSPVG